MDWPKKIEIIRNELGCSKAELTRRLGFVGQYIIDIEKGRSKNPSSKFVESLITLGVNPVWLFLDEGDVFSSGVLYDEKTELLKSENQQLKEILDDSKMGIDDVIAILDSVRGLKKKHRGKIIKYIDSLIKKDERQ